MTQTTDQTILDILALPALDFVIRSSLLLVGKEPAPEALNFYVSALHRGDDRLALLAELYGSVEAHNCRQNLSQSGSDAEFVGALYERYLGRAADADGLEYHVRQLQNRTRSEVEGDFASSPEGSAIQALLSDIEKLVLAYNSDRPWWRWPARQRRRQNIEYEVAMHTSSRASQMLDQAMLSMIRSELRSGIEQVSIETQHKPETAPPAPSHPLHNIKEGEVSQAARRTLGRLRKLTIHLVGEYA